MHIWWVVDSVVCVHAAATPLRSKSARHPELAHISERLVGLQPKETLTVHGWCEICFVTRTVQLVPGGGAGDGGPGSANQMHTRQHADGSCFSSKGDGGIARAATSYFGLRTS